MTISNVLLATPPPTKDFFSDLLTQRSSKNKKIKIKENLKKINSRDTHILKHSLTVSDDLIFPVRMNSTSKEPED